MVAWFKHDIPAWMDGTESLSDGAYRAYHVICQLIYLNEGQIALNEHGIAGRCRQSVRAFRTNLNELIAAGKLSLVDGRLRNSRAELELEKVGENRENAGKGGKASGESRRNRSFKPKPLKNNDADEATLPEKRTEKTRLDKTRRDDRRTREELDRIEGSIRQAAGLESDPSPGLLELSPILGLMDAGYSLEQICTVIRTTMRKQKPTFRPRGWAYFVPVVHEAHGRRQSAASVQAVSDAADERRRWFNMLDDEQARGKWRFKAKRSDCPPDVLREWEAKQEAA